MSRFVGLLRVVISVGVLAGGAAAVAPRPKHAEAEARVDGPAPTLVIRAVDAATGAPVVARVRVSGVLGDVAVSLAADGRAAFLLPGGTYDVTVSKGPEWSLGTRRLRVVNGRVASLRVPLSHEAQLPGWVACDLHVHTDASPDASVTARDRVTSLLAEGVDVAVRTDHNRAERFSREVLSARTGERLVGIPGVEVTTWMPEVGHFNAFPLEPRDGAPRGGAPKYSGLDAAGVVSAIRRSGARFVQVNHPHLDRHIAAFDLAGLDAHAMTSDADVPLDADGVELWNGYELAMPATLDRALEEWMALARHGRPLVPTAGSDAHGPRGPRAGYPRTMVQAGAATEDAVVAALLRGATVVTSGPLLEASVRGRGPGETVTVREHVVPLRVSVRAPAWMHVSRVEVFVSGRHVRTEALPRTPGPLRVERTLRVPVARDGFVVVVARGDDAMDGLLGRRRILPIAVSSPIWIDRDGDGVARPRAEPLQRR